MPYYHVVIKYFSKRTNKTETVIEGNYKDNIEIKDLVVEPYLKSKEFNFRGRRIDPNDVDVLKIFESKDSLRDSYKIFFDEALREGNSFETNMEVLDSEDVTDLFVTSVPKSQMKSDFKSTWLHVLDAAREFNGKPFAPIDIINKIHEKNPSVKANTIRCHIIGMTPNHPSSKYYPSVRKNHAAFDYLGNGQYQMFGETGITKIEETKKEPVKEEEKMAEWEKLRIKIVNLQGDISPFQVVFLDRDVFKRFCDNLRSNLENLREICITGYFSETIRTELESIAQNDYYHVKIISPDFPIGTPRDKKNLEALRKLSKAGVEIKFNNRLHARLLVAHNRMNGLLISGSFDFNTECIGRERYDAGIKTSHPDLIQSAVNFFEQVWNDSETCTLEEFLKDKISI